MCRAFHLPDLNGLQMVCCRTASFLKARREDTPGLNKCDFMLCCPPVFLMRPYSGRWTRFLPVGLGHDDGGLLCPPALLLHEVSLLRARMHAHCSSATCRIAPSSSLASLSLSLCLSLRASSPRVQCASSSFTLPGY
jgi:hypothetical protein